MKRPMDCTEPAAVFRRLYELISGPAEQERDWAAVRDLFDPDALLHSELTLPDGSHQSGTWSVHEFCETAAEEYRQSGFWEREVACRAECFGDIAQVWSTYESRVGSPASAPAGRGVNAVHLLRRKGTWRIVSVIFQLERGTDGIPSAYLPGHGAG
ncbi:MAG: hypothetical protein HKN71_11865 [Gemmatimonadetes bacterium]|nr:hypothetical protein [Gemmatimonadota bacterium]